MGFAWKPQAGCVEHMEKWMQAQKLAQRVEDIAPGAWFRKASDEWAGLWKRTKDKSLEWKDTYKQRQQEAEERKRFKAEERKRQKAEERKRQRAEERAAAAQEEKKEDKKEGNEEEKKDDAAMEVDKKEGEDEKA